MDEDTREQARIYFGGHSAEYAVFQTLATAMEKEFPDIEVRVAKTQISFYGKHMVGCASLPYRRFKGAPDCYLLFSLGLARPLEGPRVLMSVEIRPGRWTNHIALIFPDEVDDGLMLLVREAYAFANRPNRSLR